MSLPAPLSFMIAIPIALFTIAVIFLKVNERPFLIFINSVMQYLSSPKQRVWQHDNTDLTVEIYRPRKEAKMVYQTKDFSHEDIKKIAEQFDTAKFRK